MKEIAKKIRRKVIELLYRHRACHLGSCMSCVEILVALYFKIMRPEDKFIMSPGWKAAALYSVLSEKGIIKWKELYKKYYQLEGGYWGLVHHTVPGVIASFGSAGHGLPVAIGMALAKKLKKERGRIFCLLSDGELDCGTTWEGALFASHHKLDNLIVIIDRNWWQAFGRTEEVLKLEPLEKKWEAFDWQTQRINGHNFEELKKAFKNLSNKKPNIIICNTIKAKDCPPYEDKLESHYYNLTKEQYEETIKFLNQKR